MLGRLIAVQHFDLVAETYTKGFTMKKALVCLALFFVLFNPAAALSQRIREPNVWTGNANLFLGVKFLEKDNWEPLDKQLQGGLLVDFRKKRWPISIAADILCSGDKDKIRVTDLGIGEYHVKVESRIIEFDLGLRKIWESPKYIRPFIGGGVAVVNGHIKSQTRGESVSDDDTELGWWLDAGMYVTLSGRFNIGFDGRWSKAGVDLLGTRARVGGWHIGAKAGLHW
jgi:hypothetical protein